MIVSQHTDSLSFLSTQMLTQADSTRFWEQLSTYTEAFSILTELSLDPVRDELSALYCPTGQARLRLPRRIALRLSARLGGHPRT